MKILSTLNTPLAPLLKRWFTTGLLALLPAAAAVWVLYSIYRWLERWTRYLFPMEWLPTWLQSLIGIVILLFVITLLGVLTSNVVGRWFLNLIDLFMKQVPLANAVYSFVKGLVENLNTMQAGNFQQVVLIEYPRKGVWSLGFISRELEGLIQDAVPGERIAVFVPTSPNPTSGFIVILDKVDAISLDISPEEALKFIMSGGVLMPGITKDTGF